MVEGAVPPAGDAKTRGGPALAAWFAAYVSIGVVVATLQTHSGPSLWYPPVAIGISCLLRGGLRRWPLILAGDLVVSWLQYDRNLLVAFIVALSTTLECVFAAWLFVRVPFAPKRRRAGDVAVLFAATCALATFTGASLGSALHLLVPGIARPTWGEWFTWWTGDTVSIITLLPAITFALSPGKDSPFGVPATSRLERAALFTLAAGMALRFAIPRELWVGQVATGWVLGLVPTMWAATRFDRRTTAFTIAVLSTASIVALRLSGATLRDAVGGISPRLLVLQGNLALTAIAGMSIAHLMAKEREARRDSQRLAAELELRESHLRLAQRAGGTGSWESDLERRLVIWSETLFELCGFDASKGPPTREAFEGRIHPESLPRWSAVREAVYAGAPLGEEHIRFVLPGGREVWRAVRMERITHDGKPRILGTLTDVDELVGRRSVSEQLASIVASAMDAILTVAPNGIIRTANESAIKLFAPDEALPLVGRSLFDFVPESRRSAKLQHIRRAFAGERVEAEHADMLRADGKALPVRMSFAPVTDSRHKIVEVAILCGDLSPQRRLEAQLVQAQKMEAVGRLAGGIAHDFNNMLTAILGFSELVRARVANDPESSQDMEQVVLAAERAAALTQRLLAFSRRQPRASQRLELDALLQRLAPMMQRLIGEDLAVELRTHAATAYVSMDPTQLEQILLNLVVNARDAMPSGGRVVIETTRTLIDAELQAREPDLPLGPVVSIAFSDDGHGMDAKTLAQVFEPFFTTKETGRGTGLGLSTVLALVRENEGAIRVSSEPGIGTTFRLYFPEVTREPADERPPGVLVVEPPRGVESVLVVEDEPLVREFVAACLTGAGYHVTLAPTAEQAGEGLAAEHAAFDLLVTDIVLPKQNGIQLAAEIHEVHPGLPVLFLSGYSEALFDRELPGELLAKPFTRDALLHAVRRALQSQSRVPHR